MKRIGFLVLAVSVGLNVGLLYRVLTPGPDGDGREERRRPPPVDMGTALEGHLDRMTEHLGLHDGQRAAIQAVHEERLPGILAQRRVAADLRAEVVAHFERPEIDPEEFRALVRRLAEARGRLDALVAEAMLGEAAVLTLEQRRSYAEEMPWSRPPSTQPGRGRGGRGR